MGGVSYSVWKNNSWHGLEDVEENEELKLVSPTLPSIPQPQTPHEPIEFLSRSWSLSASEISKALSDKQKRFLSTDKNPNTLPEPVATHQEPGKVINSVHGGRMRTIGKWFHHKEYGNITVKKKDRARLESAHMHSALSVAGLAAALAAVAAAENSADSRSESRMALASATELLASYCIEMAESAGADHDRVASAVRSAVDIRTPGDLMTLTAAAATALRGETTLKARLPKESKRNAAISPYDRGIVEAHQFHAFHSQMEQPGPPCVGELLQLTRKGVLRWKHVSVYIKKSQVMAKLKSKHVGGAFSKKNKCVVYGVCDKDAAWPYKREREVSEDLYIGLKTAQGLLEFKCRNRIHKQKWVDGIEKLLRQVNFMEEAGSSMDLSSISNSI